MLELAVNRGIVEVLSIAKGLQPLNWAAPREHPGQAHAGALFGPAIADLRNHLSITAQQQRRLS